MEGERETASGLEYRDLVFSELSLVAGRPASADELEGCAMLCSVSWAGQRGVRRCAWGQLVGFPCTLDAPCRLEGDPGPGFLSTGLLPWTLILDPACPVSGDWTLEKEWI